MLNKEVNNYIEDLMERHLSETKKVNTASHSGRFTNASQASAAECGCVRLSAKRLQQWKGIEGL